MGGADNPRKLKCYACWMRGYDVDATFFIRFSLLAVDKRLAPVCDKCGQQRARNKMDRISLEDGADEWHVQEVMVT